jgi:hypothetical protein
MNNSRPKKYMEGTGVEKRRVQLTGTSTLTVSLPKAWATRNGVVPRDEILVSEEKDGSLSLRLRKTAERPRTAELGLAGPELTTIEQAGLLHDIGLVSISDTVLLKPGPLTLEERTQMRRHAEDGYRMLAAVPFLREVRKLVLLHHERWDGGGYPLGLAGAQLPLLARILHVAEAYSAMRAERPYRSGTIEAEARAEILRAAGTQFDPQVVEAFGRIPAAEWESPVLQLSPESAGLVDPPLDELRRRGIAGAL